jgi:Tfp pilus assembly protein PilX
MERSTSSRKSKGRSLALRRARARRRNAGAVMFIVVVTLGLLAAMGVYGLTATSADVKAAGHLREALQAQRAGDHALTMAAETLNPQSVGPLISQMTTANRTTNCKTAAVYAGPVVPVPPAAACLRLTEPGMRLASKMVNQWDPLVPAFATDSFGAVASVPTVQVELSDPFDVQRPGFDATSRFTQVTATVFVDVRSTIDTTAPSQAIVSGRGRLTVGPISPPPASYP